MRQPMPKCYLKQYSCYEFTHLFSQHSQPSKSLPITFHGPPIPTHGSLKTQIIDRTAADQKLYILRWKQSSLFTLKVFEFNASNAIGFTLSNRPSLVTIAQQYIYLVGGSEMYIIDMRKMQPCCVYKIDSQQLHALEPDSQGSAVLYSWSERKGFQANRYSPTVTSRSGMGWLTGLSSIFTAAHREIFQETLKVIVPGVLGLVLSETDCCLINLSNMKQVPGSKRKIGGPRICKPSQSIIKSYQSWQKGFDDSILISIGNGSCIQIIRASFLFDNPKQHKPQSLSSTNIGVLNWQKVHVQNYLSVNLAEILSDYVLTEEGIIYFCKKADGFYVPIVNFVKYSDPFNEYPILSLQHNIFAQYNIDAELANTTHAPIDLNRYIMPNRYSLPFVIWSSGVNAIEQIEPIRIDRRQLLVDWVSQYQLHAIIVFGSDLLFVRESSMSTLLPIACEQYSMQICTGLVDANHTSEDAQESGHSSKYCDQLFVEPIPEGELQGIYHSSLNRLWNRLANPTQLTTQESIQNKSPLLAKLLLRNRLKDMITFYASVLGKLFKHNQICSASSRNQLLLIHLLRSYASIANAPAQQMQRHHLDLLSIFINKHKLQAYDSYVNVDNECWNIIAKLFMELLPSKSQTWDFLNPTLNGFVKFMLDNIRNLPASSGVERYALLNIFSQVVLKGPQEVHLSNSLLVALFEMPISKQIRETYAQAYLLHVVRDVSCGDEHSVKEVLQKFVSNMFRNWSIPRVEAHEIMSNLSEHKESDCLQEKHYSILCTLIQLSELPQGHSNIDNHCAHVQPESAIIDFQTADIDAIEKELIYQTESIKQVSQIVSRQAHLDGYFKHLELETVLKDGHKPSQKLQKWLCGWIVYYRVHVHVFNQLLGAVASKNENPAGMREGGTHRYTSSSGAVATNTTQQYKPVALRLIGSCIKGFQKIKKINSLLCGSQRSDQQTAQLAGQLAIMSRLATPDWMKLIKGVLADPHAQRFETEGIICLYHVSTILSSDFCESDQIDSLKSLHDYFSKRQIGRIIAEQAYLANLVGRSRRIGAFLGYLEVNKTGSRDREFVRLISFRNAYQEAHLNATQ